LPLFLYSGVISDQQVWVTFHSVQPLRHELFVDDLHHVLFEPRIPDFALLGANPPVSPVIGEVRLPVEVVGDLLCTKRALDGQQHAERE
jgi:hypothetical protein